MYKGQFHKNSLCGFFNVGIPDNYESSCGHIVLTPKPAVYRIGVVAGFVCIKS